MLMMTLKKGKCLYTLIKLYTFAKRNFIFPKILVTQPQSRHRKRLPLLPCSLPLNRAF